MVKTQIQLPTDLYRRAKQLARARETSLAELARTGLEYVLSVQGAPETPVADWRLPTPRRMGWKRLSAAELKEEAQRSSSEDRAARG